MDREYTAIVNIERYSVVRGVYARREAWSCRNAKTYASRSQIRLRFTVTVYAHTTKKSKRNNRDGVYKGGEASTTRRHGI